MRTRCRSIEYTRICYSLNQPSYFDRCLEGGRFEEGTSHSIKCPEDNLDDMAIMIQYMYTRHFQNPHCVPHADRSKDGMPYLIHLYVTADKYCIGAMAKAILHAIKRTNRARIPSSTRIWHRSRNAVSMGQSCGTWLCFQSSTTSMACTQAILILLQC
jgi:hypothetical protein